MMKNEKETTIQKETEKKEKKVQSNVNFNELLFISSLLSWSYPTLVQKLQF